MYLASSPPDLDFSVYIRWHVKAAAVSIEPRPEHHLDWDKSNQTWPYINKLFPIFCLFFALGFVGVTQIVVDSFAKPVLAKLKKAINKTSLTNSLQSSSSSPLPYYYSHLSIYQEKKEVFKACMSKSIQLRSSSEPKKHKLINKLAHDDDDDCNAVVSEDDDEAAEAHQLVDMRHLTTRGKWRYLVSILNTLNKVRGHIASE